MPDQQDPYARNAQGCALSPTIIVAIALSFVWLMVVIPAYRNWRYPPQEKPAEVAQPDDGGREVSAEPAAATRTGGAKTPGELAQGVAEAVVPVGPANGLAAAVAELPEAPKPTDPKLPEKTHVVETDAFVFEFTTRGASVRSASLKNYHFTPDDTDPLELLHPLGGSDGNANSFILRPVTEMGAKSKLFGDLADTTWELEKIEDDFDANDMKRVIFRIARNNVELRKVFTLDRSGKSFELAVEITNRTGARFEDVRIDLVGPNGLVPDETKLKAKASRTQITAMLAGRNEADEDVETKSISFGEASNDDILARSLSKGGRGLNEWAAVKNRYFAAIMQVLDPATVEGFAAMPVDPQKYLTHSHLGQENIAVSTRILLQDLESGRTLVSRHRVYIGPLYGQEFAAIKCGNRTGDQLGWDALVSHGWFASLSKILLWFLRLFYVGTQHLGSIVGGFGLAILLLTLALKSALHPLQRKAMVSMHKMQKLAPEMKEIRKRYEKDKAPESQRKMQLELMELHKKHGVSPLGGCLPMLVQLPMFIAFYGMLRGAFELRQASFLWISDLGQPDVLFKLGFRIPWLEWEALHLLPIIYAGLFLLQQKLQPKPTDPQAEQMQKTMKFMVIFFFFLFYNMPSGLVLYFVFSSAFSLVESWYIRKHLNLAPAAAGPQISTDGGATAAPAPPTSWDKQAAKEKRAADKRKKRKEGGGQGMRR